MQNQLKELWLRATAKRAKNILLPAYSPEEKIRFKQEAAIIEQTGMTEQILSFVKQADEARKKGNFYVEGAANCSFLLYAVGATTVYPFRTHSPFELFINPLTENKPEYKIVFADEPVFTPEENEMEYGEFIIKRAVKSGLLSEEQLRTNYTHPTAQNYQFVYEVISETNQNLIWYEQAIELLSRMGGFTYAEADLMRRACNEGFSENGIRYPERRRKFINHAVQVGYSSYFAERFFDYIFKEFSNTKLLLKSHVAAIAFGRNV